MISKVGTVGTVGAFSVVPIATTLGILGLLSDLLGVFLRLSPVATRVCIILTTMGCMVHMLDLLFCSCLLRYKSESTITKNSTIPFIIAAIIGALVILVTAVRSTDPVLSFINTINFLLWRVIALGGMSFAQWVTNFALRKRSSSEEKRLSEEGHSSAEHSSDEEPKETRSSDEIYCQNILDETGIYIHPAAFLA